MTQNCARAVSPRSIVPTCLALSAALLAACEAPLELDAVNEHAQQAIQRTDFYQAMAANSERTLLVGNRGTLLASEDHGQHWQREAVNTNASFIDIASCPDNSFLIKWKVYLRMYSCLALTIFGQMRTKQNLNCREKQLIYYIHGKRDPMNGKTSLTKQES